MTEESSRRRASYRMNAVRREEEMHAFTDHPVHPPGRAESTWDRLAAVKRRYDPTDLFRLNQKHPTGRRRRIGLGRGLPDAGLCVGMVM